MQQLKYQLHTVKMDTSSMSEYIQSAKSIVDNLAAVANPVADSDLVSTLLSGLSPEYDSFVTSVNTRVDPVLSEELIGLILAKRFIVGVYHFTRLHNPHLPFSCGSYCLPQSKLPFGSIFFSWSWT